MKNRKPCHGAGFWVGQSKKRPKRESNMGSRTLTGKEAKSCRNAARMESPMIRKGQVVRFTLCTPESEPCPQFAAYTNLGSWVVANCEDCKPPPALTPSPDIGLSCTCLIAGVINLTDDYCGNRISHAACRFDYPSTGLCRWAVPAAALPQG